MIPVVTTLIVLAGYFFYQMRTGRVFIDDSLVQAPVTSVTPANNGKLTDVLVYEGESVQRGDPIALVGGQMVYADTTGTISMVNNQLGSQISTQTPVAQIVRTHDMRIAGTLDENKGLQDIKPGQVVSFTIDALPGQTFWGYVDEVSPAAKQTQLTFSISSERPTQQFVIYARYNESAYPQIKQGMSAKMTVYTQTVQ